MYFDYLQIGKSKTIAAPYVLRAYPGAPVATPLEWNEVTPGPHPKQFNIRNARERFAEEGRSLPRACSTARRISTTPCPVMEKLFK